MKNIDSKKLIDAGKVDEVKEEVRKAMQSKVDELSRTIDSLKKTVDEKEATIRDELIGGRFARSNYIKERLAVPGDMVRALWGKNYRVEEGNVVGHGKDGNPIYSKQKPGELAEFDEALSLLIEDYPEKHLILKGSPGTGPGIQPGSKGLMKSDWKDLPPAERIKYGRDKGGMT